MTDPEPVQESAPHAANCGVPGCRSHTKEAPRPPAAPSPEQLDVECPCSCHNESNVGTCEDCDYRHAPLRRKGEEPPRGAAAGEELVLGPMHVHCDHDAMRAHTCVNDGRSHDCSGCNAVRRAAEAQAREEGRKAGLEEAEKDRERLEQEIVDNALAHAEEREKRDKLVGAARLVLEWTAGYPLQGTGSHADHDAADRVHDEIEAALALWPTEEPPA